MSNNGNRVQTDKSFLDPLVFATEKDQKSVRNFFSRLTESGQEVHVISAGENYALGQAYRLESVNPLSPKVENAVLEIDLTASIVYCQDRTLLDWLRGHLALNGPAPTNLPFRIGDVVEIVVVNSDRVSIEKAKVRGIPASDFSLDLENAEHLFRKTHTSRLII